MAETNAPEQMHEMQGPLDPKTQIAANIDYTDPKTKGASEKALGADKEYRDGTENLRAQSSNALSFDSSGATQFTNLNAKAVPDNYHTIPDGSNVNLRQTEEVLVPKEQLGQLAGGVVDGEEGLGTKAETDVPAPGLQSESESVHVENDPQAQPGQRSADEVSAANTGKPATAAGSATKAAAPKVEKDK